VSRDSADAARHVVRSRRREPISTYLFAFAAGDAAGGDEAERNGRTFTMYHRETDSGQGGAATGTPSSTCTPRRSLARGLHGDRVSVRQVRFFAVPAFQFGGMEHPGAIWYRAESLFLDETASRTRSWVAPA
jgi:aminopeptidase N